MRIPKAVPTLHGLDLVIRTVRWLWFRWYHRFTTVQKARCFGRYAFP